MLVLSAVYRFFLRGDEAEEDPEEELEEELDEELDALGNRAPGVDGLLHHLVVEAQVVDLAGGAAAAVGDVDRHPAELVDVGAVCGVGGDTAIGIARIGTGLRGSRPICASARSPCVAASIAPRRPPPPSRVCARASQSGSTS